MQSHRSFPHPYPFFQMGFFRWARLRIPIMPKRLSAKPSSTTARRPAVEPRSKLRILTIKPSSVTRTPASFIRFSQSSWYSSGLHFRKMTIEVARSAAASRKRTAPPPAMPPENAANASKNATTPMACFGLAPISTRPFLVRVEYHETPPSLYPNLCFIASEEEDDVPCKCELAILQIVVVRGTVIGMFEAEFRPEKNRCADPVAPAQKMLGIFCFCAGALADDVIKELIADG